MEPLQRMITCLSDGKEAPPDTKGWWGGKEKKKVMFPQQNNLEEVLQRFLSKEREGSIGAWCNTAGHFPLIRSKIWHLHISTVGRTAAREAHNSSLSADVGFKFELCVMSHV